VTEEIKLDIGMLMVSKEMFNKAKEVSESRNIPIDEVLDLAIEKLYNENSESQKEIVKIKL